MELEFILPYPNAIDAFLAIFNFLPDPLRDYINANLFFFSVVAVVRRWLDS